MEYNPSRKSSSIMNANNNTSSNNNANITIVTGSPLCGPASTNGLPPSSALIGSCLTAGSSTFQLSPAGGGGAASVRILSFNIWGIFNSKYRKQRIAHFGATKVKDYDVICLQEQFEEADFRLLVESIPEPLRNQLHYKRFPSSFIGSGLAVISRYEITHAQYCVYPTQSYPEKVYHGDCYAKKGVAMVRLLVPTSQAYNVSTAASHNVSSHSLAGSSTMGGGGRAGGDRDAPTTELTVYTTHLVAQYEKVSRLGSFEKEMYAHYRISQVMTLATFICSTSRPCDNVVLCGDFNASPSSPELKLLLAYCQCRGGLDFVRTLADDDASNFTYTYDNQFNTDSTSYLKFMDMQEDIPVQLDHIFFCGKQMSLVPAEVGNMTDVAPCFHSHNYEAPHGVVVFTNNKEVQTGNAGCPTCPLSDHFGVVARFLVAAASGGVSGGVPATPLPTSSRIMASSSFASVHPPALVVDPSAHRKSLEFAASFLGRSAASLRLQSTRMTRVACLLGLLPLVLYTLEYLLSERAAQNEQGVLGTLIALGSAFFLYPVVMFVLGAGCLVTLLLARVQRINDAVVMGWQAEELRALVSSCDWS